MIDASIPMAAGQAGAFDLAGMMREVQSQKMRQMQMDQAAEKQRQEQARHASLASMVGEYSRTGTLPTQGPAFDSYVQNAPEDAFKMLSALDEEKRAKVAAGVKDLAAAVQWADTPEKWQQVQSHYAQYDPQLASVPFEGREGALMQLGQMGSYLEQQNKQNEQYTLSPGAKRFDAKGNLIAEAAFAPHYGTVSEGETAYVANPSNPWAGVATGIAQQFGLKPEEVAAVMSYETGGTFSPTIMGGKGGNYMGLIQFGPSERQKYGITNKSTPEQWTQAIGSFLTDRGFKPGMNILDFYSTINAGQPGRYNASDGNGTVSSHVGNILSGRHIQNAKQWLGGSQVIAQGGPKQKEAPSGYRWKADGSLEPIPGGPATRSTQQNKPIPATQEKNISEQFGIYAALDRAVTNFNPEFAGNTMTGGAENMLQGLFNVGTPGQRDWWADFRQTDNLIRNQMFGSALTNTEKSAYEATTISERMAPEQVIRNLKRRKQIVEQALQRKAKVLSAQGYNPEAVSALFGDDPNILGGSVSGASGSNSGNPDVDSYLKKLGVL